MKLDPAAVAAGVRLIERETVGSTNTEALVLARAGERGPLWITARRQSAGRGRRGRVWVSEPGNLYASLLLTDPSPPDRAAELSFVAGLAVHDAVVAIAPAGAARFALKWPNDVLVDGKKVSGILIEGEGPAVVVGIGVNCVQHPDETSYPAADLAAVGVCAPLEDLFARLSATMMRRLAQWDRGTGFAAIRADWLARAAGVGGPICVALADGERAGRFETVDAHGRLVLKLSNGSSETITAGDVFALAPERGRLAMAGR
jgi:BirA family transcriptional regulator, biotin operon repressor / biotin---[acetyl-CoA-carboxylase] ligase